MAIRGSSGVVSPRVQWPSSGGWPWSGLGAVKTRLALPEHREEDGGTSARLVRGLSAMVRGPAGRILVHDGSHARHRVPDEADSNSQGPRRSASSGMARGGAAEHRRELGQRGPQQDRDSLRTGCIQLDLIENVLATSLAEFPDRLSTTLAP